MFRFRNAIQLNLYNSKKKLFVAIEVLLKIKASVRPEAISKDASGYTRFSLEKFSS
jgi:hypothetical protein